MYSFLFSVCAAVALAMGYTQNRGAAWVWWCLAGMFVFFILFRSFVHWLSERRLNKAFLEQLDAYTKRFGNTSSGQKFLNDTPAWHEGLFAKGAEMTVLTGDWHEVLIAGIAEWVGSYFSTTTKPAEQSVMEQQLVRVFRQAAEGKQRYHTSMTMTTLAYVAAAIGTYMILVPKPIEATAPVPAPHTLTTAAENQKIAIQRYPALGVAGSSFNIAFVARYNLYQKTRPDYFKDPAWPLLLADEVSKSSTSTPSRRDR